MIPERIKPILDADAQAYVKRLAGWPYAGVAPKADEWARRKYLFAREIWPKRDEICQGFKDGKGHSITWAQRFEQLFWEPLEDYRGRVDATRPVAA